MNTLLIVLYVFLASIGVRIVYAIVIMSNKNRWYIDPDTKLKVVVVNTIKKFNPNTGKQEELLQCTGGLGKEIIMNKDEFYKKFIKFKDYKNGK